MNKKILIVRGDRRNAKALSFLLSGSGFTTSTHGSASEAIEAAKHQRFDLAITDGDLPENQPNLGLVSTLKEAQPRMPIFYLSEEKNLDTVIECIRAGVTEVISGSKDLKHVIETTQNFLRSDNQNTSPQVTWEDILEVETVLEQYKHEADGDSAPISSAEVVALEEKLSAAIKERDQACGDLAANLAELEKSRRLIGDLKQQGGNRSSEIEIAERTAALEERERRYKEMSAKLSLQKVEVETQLAELEAQQIEFEEAKKDAPAAGEGEIVINNAQFEAERMEFNAKRLDLEARIQDLERDLAKAQTKSSSETALEQEVESLREKINDLKESISEKDFIIQQRDTELKDLKEKVESTAGNIDVEELENEKRLIQVERHKLNERIEQFEIEKRIAEERHAKDQREITVERRDAEVSLREMQNAIREDKLKLQVEQATLKDEMRQFEQARQNFQEDVEELQTKQSELRKMEAFLRQREATLGDKAAAPENTLPSSESDALEPMQLRGQDAPEAPAPTAPEAGAETGPEAPAGKPGEWKKPNMEKKAGRGPLRIGRRSTF